MKRATLGAVIPAAGRSSRMGRDKALLDLGGRSALARAVEACRAGGAEGIVVVVAPRADALRQEALALGARVAVNTAPDATGPLGSVQAGLLEVPGDPAGVLVFPVDHAMVGAATVAALAQALAGPSGGAAAPAGVLLPTFQGRRGHPVCLAAALVEEVLALPRKATLREVTLADPHRIQEVPVEDPWILRDLDDPEDLRLAIEALGCR